MSLMSKMFNTPMMMDLDYLKGIISTDMLLQGFSSNKILKKTFTDLDIIEKESSKFFSVRNQVVKNNNAIISVFGPLSQRLDFWSWWFGGASYEEIMQNHRAALDNNDVETIIFEIDSGGGGVAGLFDAVDEIKAARGQKRTIAMVNEAAYSAAYAIASAADEIYIPRTGGAGSIGVIAIHTDLSKWEEKIGVKYTAIFAGDRKNDFTPHEPLSDAAYKVVKAEIDDIYKIFIDTVSKNRGVDVEIIRNMEAGIYQGQKAVDIGLADEIKTFANVINKGGKKMSKSLFEAICETIKDAKPIELAKAMDQLGYVEKEGTMSEADHEKAMDAQAKELNSKMTEAVKIESDVKTEEYKKEVISILELCSIGGVEEMGLKFISEGVSKDDARSQIMKAKVPGQTINSTVHPLHSGETNPLLVDAERRAKEARA